VGLISWEPYASFGNPSTFLAFWKKGNRIIYKLVVELLKVLMSFVEGAFFEELEDFE
jgi:hypothetical protein